MVAQAPHIAASTVSKNTESSALETPTINPSNSIDAPIVGTFYQAASPDSDPFVKLVIRFKLANSLYH